VTKNALSAANTHTGAYEWYAPAAISVQQQQRTVAFLGWQGVTSAIWVCWRGSVGSQNWVTWLGGIVGIGGGGVA